MGKAHAPRRGSLQFWPRVRARREVARIRQWPTVKETKPIGFLGYKAGMCHVIAIDNRPKSLSKDEEISIPATLIECPPMKIAGINFYVHDITGSRLLSTVLSSSVDKELERLVSFPKKIKSSVDQVKEFDDLRILVYTQPKLTGIGSKKPKLVELALGGSKEDKLKYASEHLGKELTINEVFGEGNLIDIHAVTTGKGFQGPVKRHGIMMRHHKSEKARRANIRGPWGGPKMWTVPHSGKMGYNQRTEYNKWVLKIGKQEDLKLKTGINHYGFVKNQFILIKGSLAGVKKRVVTLTHPIRPSKQNVPKEAPTIKEIVL